MQHAPVGGGGAHSVGLQGVFGWNVPPALWHWSSVAIVHPPLAPQQAPVIGGGQVVFVQVVPSP